MAQDWWQTFTEPWKITIYSEIISINSGKISIYSERIAIYSGKITIYGERIAIYTGKIAIDSGKIMKNHYLQWDNHGE